MSGSGSAIDTGAGKWTWGNGDNNATEGQPSNHMFGADETTASASVYLTFDIKVGTGWVDPTHLFCFMTDAEVDPFWDGPSPCFLQVMCELQGRKPDIYCTDGKRIQSGTILGGSYPHSNPTPSLLGTSSTHAAFGGNGFQTSADGLGYFTVGPELHNNTRWDAPSNVFVANTWHSCKFYAQMNTFSGGVPQANGILKYWVDGVVILNITNAYIRTPGYENQKFCRLLLAPYMTNGATGAQSLWLDNVVVGDSLPAETSTNSLLCGAVF